MVVIFSHDNDFSTCEVIDWLTFYKIQFIKINSSEIASLKKLSFEGDLILKVGNTEIDLKDVTAFWFRKGGLNLHYSKAVDSSLLFAQRINNFFASEKNYLTDFLYKAFQQKRCLGNFISADPNKLEVLQTAKECGLDIPPTLVTTQKRELQSFKDSHHEIIVKSIGTMAGFNEGENSMYAYTEIVTQDFIDTLPEIFQPSLFQEKIDKKYELRIFYLNGLFYPMAIFSQLDPQTSVDFRKYNREKPNRTVPYTLREEQKEKLHNLMQHFNFNTGSIDIVVDVRGKHYFLEVNPVGQFGMVSYPCNYDLENQIAKFLSDGK